MAPDSTAASPAVLVLLVIVVAVTVLYSVFVAAAPLAGVGMVVPLLFLYLAWRFVRAHERIADAMERPGKDAE